MPAYVPLFLASITALSAEIETALGPLQGVYNAAAATGEFKGIPYANQVS